MAMQMPDARIPLANLSPDVAIQGPHDWRQRAARTQNDEAIARANALKVQELEDARAEQAAIQRIAQETGGAWDVMIPRLRAVAPGAAVKYEQELAEVRKTMALAAKDEAELERQSIEYASSVLRSIRTPEQYAALRPRLAAINEDLAELLPEGYDQAALEQIQQMAIGAQDAATANAKAAELFLNGKPMEAVGRILSAALDDEDWQEGLAVARHYLPPEALAIFPRQFSPEAKAQAAELALSADQRADNARADAQQAETRRHNAATESTARGNLAVAQGNLAVAQGNLAVRRDDARRAAAGETGAPLSAEDRDLVERIVANPAIYQDLTPGARTKLAGALAARGFTGFGKAAGGASGSAKGGPDVGEIMSEIKTLSGRINTSAGGPVSNITGAIRRGLGVGNLDNDVAEYQALIEGFIPMVARAVGHSGVLTQADVDSVRALFPLPSDNATLAKNKIARVEKLLRSGQSAPSAPSAPATPTPAQARPRQPIPGIPGGIAELQPDGRWKRVQ